MKRVLTILSFVVGFIFNAYAQYPYKWQIGGTIGMGGTIYTGGAIQR